jgi:predicted acyl esterase
MHRSLKILVCLLVATVLLGTWSAVVVGQPAAKTFMVPMSDGVKLATDVYWPSDGKEP